MEKDVAFKTLEQMSLTEKMDWSAGHLILAIGEGKFRERLSMILQAIMSESYDRGLAAGKEK